MKLMHWSNLEITPEHNKIRDSTYTNAGRLIEWLETQQRYLASAQARVDALCDIVDTCSTIDDLSWSYPVARIHVPFQILECDEGLIYEDDHDKHPTLEHHAVVYIERRSIRIRFVCCQDHDTFTVEL